MKVHLSAGHATTHKHVVAHSLNSSHNTVSTLIHVHVDMSYDLMHCLVLFKVCLFAALAYADCPVVLSGQSTGSSSKEVWICFPVTAVTFTFSLTTLNKHTFIQCYYINRECASIKFDRRETTTLNINCHNFE